MEQLLILLLVVLLGEVLGGFLFTAWLGHLATRGPRRAAARAAQPYRSPPFS
ncbi:hypothetical protein [Deinococcus irradiatisoli]|uniref:hypothetical protein n=1 Tax=Deinococcus irradiatisoli TaxID=2202254 RepID=UPI0015E84F44|nr:hypothetical protein [Deinococcus irradiatisoli]